ncbi:MAG: GNAT family N-acetyltransferase [Polyangiaceae bacterium]|nr:GNAT family N-acetyltransferase [Polyangiaceae bacterium]
MEPHDRKDALVARESPEITIVTSGQELPEWTSREALAVFIHEFMKPYEDTLPDTRRGVDDALGHRPDAGGFVVLARVGRRLAGALVMLRTGMRGYVPENLLLFVAVDDRLRGHGIGGTLIRAAVARCDGSVKLHVEYDNPARRLYQRLGFTNKYAEMRLVPEETP